MSSELFTVAAEDITDEDYSELSQTSNQSQFRFEGDSSSNYKDDSEFVPSEDDESSQEFSQVNFWTFLFSF